MPVDAQQPVAGAQPGGLPYSKGEWSLLSYFFSSVHSGKRK
ncbi:hypothetical protein SSAG_06274 [Streptomyces sp. Mg1]|nr:hypothetical protein SSAG_06274 [Streptomyces sp. Mg1]